MPKDFILVAFSIAIIILGTSLHRKEKEIDKLKNQYARTKLSYACSNDNLNFMQECLARFASAIFSKPIPSYDENQTWRPGDFVSFKTILGDKEYKGEIEVNIDDEGMMQDRCPVSIRVLNMERNEDRMFQFEQVHNVRLVHRPEYFQEALGKRRNN